MKMNKKNKWVGLIAGIFCFAAAIGGLGTTKDNETVTNNEPVYESKLNSRNETTLGVAETTAFTIPVFEGDLNCIVNNNIPYFTEPELEAAKSSYEYYSDLDELGRCGVCMASISQELMPTEERTEIGSIKPTGWVQEKYPDVVDYSPPYLYNRCHLIAFCLTGENANEKNLITGTRAMNVEGMLPYESKVANYIDRTNHHVLYRVTPIFEGDNLLASGVLMEARSVEDDEIAFCVYCFNVQPGIEINYEDGSSRQAEESVIDSKEPTVTVLIPPDARYAVNAGNGKIHKVGECSATGTGDSAMKQPVYFETYEDAEAYSIQIEPDLEKRKCGNCW